MMEPWKILAGITATMAVATVGAYVVLPEDVVEEVEDFEITDDDFEI